MPSVCCVVLLCFVSVFVTLSTSKVKLFVLLLKSDGNFCPFLFPGPNYFQIPHSLSLDKKNGHLFVADRENSRVLVFETEKGKLLREIKDFGERVFAMHYHPEKGDDIYVIQLA